MGLLTPAATSSIRTAFGAFTVDVFAVSGSEIVVLRTQDIPGKVHNVLCRIQSECISHVFGGELSCDCASQIEGALQRIQQAGTGLLIYLRQEGMGLGLAGKLLGDSRDWRIYDIAAEILINWGIKSVRLISINKQKIESLRLHGIEVEVDHWTEGQTILLGEHMRRTVDQIKRGEKQRPLGQMSRPRVLILGDLNIDEVSIGQTAVGGSGFYPAAAFEEASHFTPIIFGKVGRDANGDQIRKELRDRNICSLVGIHEEKATGSVNVTKTSDPRAQFQFVWEKRNNANDYDPRNLEQAIELAGIGPGDYAYVSTYLFVQKLFQVAEVAKIMAILSATQCRIILDIARKSFAWDVLEDCEATSFDENDVKKALHGTEIYTVIGEVGTFDFFKLVSGQGRPSQEDRDRILKFFGAKYLICRYVTGRERRQFVATSGGVVLSDSERTIPHMHVGSSDKAIAVALQQIEQYEQMQQ